MKLKMTLLIASLALGISFTSCDHKEGQQADEPSFFTKKDSMSQKPAMGDPARPNQTGN